MKKLTKKPKVNIGSPAPDFMGGTPSREEIAKYVQSIMENFYIPIISSQIQLSSMIMQAILLEKKVCTNEEIKTIAAEFIREHKFRELAIKNQAAITALLVKQVNFSDTEIDLKTENGLLTRLSAALKLLETEDYGLTEDQKPKVVDVFNLALTSLVQLNMKKTEGLTDKDMRDISLRAIELRNELVKAKFPIEFPEQSTDFSEIFRSSLIHLLTEVAARSALGVNPPTL